MPWRLSALVSFSASCAKFQFTTDWSVREFGTATRPGPGGIWTASQPCLFFEPCLGPVVDGVPHNIVRSPDTVHFCPTATAAVDGVVPGCGAFSSGALRYALAMLSAPMAELGL